MTKLIILYIGTFFLAYLSQQYYPMASQLVSGKNRHFIRNQTDIFLFAIIVWMTLFSGLRTSYNDTVNYIVFFEDAALNLSDHFATSTETGLADNPLYYIIEVLVKGIVDNYHVWFLLTAFFSSFTAIKFFKHYSNDFPFTLLVYFAIGTYILYVAAIKQSIAVVIIMCAIPFALKHKWIPYYLLVFLAVLFHTHAFLLLFLPLLLVKPWGKITWIFVAAAVFAMATYNSTLGAFMEYAQSIGANVAEIEVFDGHSVNMLRVLVYGVVPVLEFVFRKRLFYDSSETENLFSNMSILSWLILSIGTVEGGNLFARMAGYFEWGTALALPWMIRKLFNKRSQQLVLCIAGVCYSIYFLYEFGVSKGFGDQYRAITLWQFVVSLFQ